MLMSLDEWKTNFPVGSKVTTDFYEKQKYKERIVKGVYKSDTRSQSGVMLQTTCGLYIDIGWFK